MSTGSATPRFRLHRTPRVEPQADLTTRSPAMRRGLTIRTLVRVRWLALLGQALTLGLVYLLLGHHLPLIWCGGLILASAALNLGVGMTAPRGRLANDSEAVMQLGFDVIQLAGLLFLTGGAANPFALLLIGPVTLAAATLSIRHAAVLGALAVLCTLVLTVAYLPLPWRNADSLELPLLYRAGMAVAISAGICFTAGYAWFARREASRMELALDVTQTVLAREQRLSALGGLAAAAAHELGTPLATIAVVAKELARELPDELKDDARLLLSQTDRCRDILRRLTETPETGDEMHERMSLTQFLDEVIEPHADSPVRVEAVVAGAQGVKAPDIRRMPEALHALTTLIDNATDFAKNEVLVTARFDADSIAVEVRDDGPGFAPEVLARLGQPYVTTRPSGEESRSGHTGMGLGFFIAKTLLERSGARVSFDNAKRGGAVVAARWPRARIEAPAI
jgi:two-component system sensor histidine kinase RegB